MIELQNEIALLNGSPVEVPSYWQSAIETAIDKVKAIQNVGGKDVVHFIHFSDMHYNSGGRTNYTDNIGIISKKLMDELKIPIIVGTGDITEQGTASASDIIDSDVKEALNTLSPVGLENLLYCKGNHDGAWGSKADYGASYAMIQHPTKLWNSIYRCQAQDFRRVFSDDGSYYYVDNIPQKVRYIVLNSHWADYSNITDLDYNAQATEYNTQKNINYGDEQAEWLATKALDFDDKNGWSVIVYTHAPLWNKHNGVTKSYMNVQYAGTNNAVVIREILVSFYKKTSVNYKKDATIDFSNVGENNTIVGVWCGHCHTDLICKQDENTPSGYTSEFQFPIISITSATNTNSSYEESFGVPITTRTQNSNTETAFDVVSINKKTKRIYCTRIGAGSDRNTFYGESTDTTVELQSISAQYNNGQVSVGTDINSLIGITVTAHYSDGSTSTVTNYTMSGSISNVGNNIITISYGGKTTTITVVGESVIVEPEYTNIMVVQTSNINKRISGTNITGTSGNGSFIADAVEVDVTKECPVIFKNFASNMAELNPLGAYGNSKVVLLDASKNCLAVWYIAHAAGAGAWACPAKGSDCVGDLESLFYSDSTSIPTAGTRPSADKVKYAIFSPQISNSAITTDSLTGLEIQMLR